MAAVKDFSVEEKLVSLLTLQKVDSKIDEIRTLKGELPMEVKDLEDDIEGMNTRNQNLDAEIASIDEFIEQKNAGKKDSASLIKKYEKQLDSVRNNREADALHKEVEMQELEMQLNDKHIRDAQFQQGERRAQRNRTEEKITTLNDALKQKKAELEKIVADTEKEEKVLTKEANVAREKVDPRMLSAYERIRSSYRNGLAVVPIMRDSCGGCFNVIPPQRQSEIRQHKKVIVCEHCGRILVDNELNDQITIKK